MLDINCKNTSLSNLPKPVFAGVQIITKIQSYPHTNHVLDSYLLCEHKQVIAGRLGQLFHGY